MIILKNTTESLELITTSSAAIDVSCSFVDITTSTIAPSSQETLISSNTTTTILAAPAASTQRQVKLITIKNHGTVSNTITLQKDISSTNYILYSCSLSPGEFVTYTDGVGFSKYVADGSFASISNINKAPILNATSIGFSKVGATVEGAGIISCMYAAGGNPGAWVPGTPGLSGRTTDGTTSTDAGCLPVKNAVSGANYLTGFTSSMTVTGSPMLIDILWVNSGIGVTTTTSQTINSVKFPARDAEGTDKGENVMVGILVTSATSNAGAILNTTLSYTDQDGNAGNTATLASFPATAVAGTLVPFQLASRTSGVRSIESITLGTTYGGGAISLVAYTIVGLNSNLVANAGGVQMTNIQSSNVRLFDGVCLIPCYIPTTTTATTYTGFINIEEK